MLRLANLIDLHLKYNRDISDNEFSKLEKAAKLLREGSMKIKMQTGDISGATDIQAAMLLDMMASSVMTRSGAVIRGNKKLGRK